MRLEHLLSGGERKALNYVTVGILQFQSLRGTERETIDMLQKQLDENENTRTPQAMACDGKGKESKGGRWIPRLQEAKKDAASCENPW